MSDNDGRKANGVGAINANDGNSHDNVNVNESSPKVVADASKRGTSEGKNATKILVEDRANHAIAQPSNGGSSSSNENRLEIMQEPGTDTKTSFVNSARVHSSALALLAHLWDGKFWFLDVNANHVSLEKTGPIQNTLAGNPTRSETANAESIDSSVVAAIITNKPEKGCAEVTDVSKTVSVSVSIFIFPWGGFDLTLYPRLYARLLYACSHRNMCRQNSLTLLTVAPATISFAHHLSRRVN